MYYRWVMYKYTPPLFCGIPPGRLNPNSLVLDHEWKHLSSPGAGLYGFTVKMGGLDLTNENCAA